MSCGASTLKNKKEQKSKNVRVKITCKEPSPYNGQYGVVVGTKKNLDKYFRESTIYLVRLDKPHRSGFEVVGFPEEGIQEVMRTYSADEWANAQYTDHWGDNPYNRSRVEAGELPAKYIGRRTIMIGSVHGCTLLTEGAHFLVDDEEGRKYVGGAAV